MRMIRMLALLAVLWAIPAAAVVDLEANKMGIYYDLTADTQCLDQVGASDQFSVYLVFTNSVLATLGGFEAGVYPSSDLVFLGGTLPGAESPVVGLVDCRDIRVPFYPPLPCTTATVLIRLDFMGVPTGFEPVDLYLRDAVGSTLHGDLPAIIMGSSTLVPVAVTTTDGYPGDLSAVVNGTCEPAPVEGASMDAVKALFR